MKLVHFADLHLDAHFAWLGGTPQLARQRRQALRETLLRVTEVAREVQAEALLSGGDLFEHERVTPDTAEFLKSAFSALAPTRVFLAPGNHDWLGPESIYNQAGWSSNVHIFRSARLEPVALEDGVTLWGAAHCAPANTDGFLDSFRVDRGGVNLALFHGSERSWFTSQGSGKVPHAPFDAAQIAEAGLDFAFVGHFHTPKDAPRFSYPGNPEPLAFGETGNRGVLIATVRPGWPVSIERREVASTHLEDVVIDLTGCAHQQDVRERVLAAASGLPAFARATLEGEVAPEVDVELADLQALVGPTVHLRVGAVTFGYNLEAIRTEPTIRGRFVQDVLNEPSLAEDTRRRILVTGLRALEGRTDLGVL